MGIVSGFNMSNSPQSQSVSDIAGSIAQADEAVMRALPYISMIIGFVPGAQVAVPLMPLVGAVLAAVDSAAKSVAVNGKGRSAVDVLQEIIRHNTAGLPDSPSLSFPQPNPALPAFPPPPPRTASDMESA